MNIKNKESGFCFFDIDGVLNTSSDWNKKYTFRPELVKRLAQFVKEENLELIMTSSWRIGFEAPNSSKNLSHIKKLENEFLFYGVEISGKTPVFKEKGRDYEIERFLYYHPSNRYVIIDDDISEFNSIVANLIIVDNNKGISKKNLKQCKILLI